MRKLNILLRKWKIYRGSKSLSEGKLMLAALVLIFVPSVYTLYMEIKMLRVIRRESDNSLTNVINSIGRE
jgi:hypothetical protein